MTNGVRTVTQLCKSLSSPSVIGSTVHSFRDAIMSNTEYGFNLIEPPEFQGTFNPGQAVVCLDKHLKVFWNSVSWVEDYLKRCSGSCHFSVLQCTTMLDIMPYYMARLFDGNPYQLRLAIFAATNRRFTVSGGRIKLLQNPLTFEELETSKPAAGNRATSMSPKPTQTCLIDLVGVPDWVEASTPSRPAQEALLPGSSQKDLSSGKSELAQSQCHTESRAVISF